MNGIKFLLDTNIVITMVRQDEMTLDLLQTKQVRLNECAYSAVTRMELLSFAAMPLNDKETIELLLNRMTYLSITKDIENATIEFRRLHKTKLPDSIIAATARHYQLELLTFDKKLASKL